MSSDYSITWVACFGGSTKQSDIPLKQLSLNDPCLDLLISLVLCLWGWEGMRGRITVGSFSSFVQPVADMQVQRLLRQNENYSPKTRMGCYPHFFLLHIWKGLLWTSSSLKEWSRSAVVPATKNGFVSRPLSSEPKAQSWAGIGLSLKCCLLPEATRWRKSQEKLLGTFISEAAPAGSAAFSPSYASLPHRSIQCQN